jgi:predicted metal-dependent peptidase
MELVNWSRFVISFILEIHRDFSVASVPVLLNAYKFILYKIVRYVDDILRHEISHICLKGFVIYRKKKKTKQTET